jgi:hypothetical protein
MLNWISYRLKTSLRNLKTCGDSSWNETDLLPVIPASVDRGVDIR